MSAANTGTKELWLTEYGNINDATHLNYLTDLLSLADYIRTVPRVTISMNHQIISGVPSRK